MQISEHGDLNRLILHGLEIYGKLPRKPTIDETILLISISSISKDKRVLEIAKELIGKYKNAEDFLGALAAILRTKDRERRMESLRKGDIEKALVGLDVKAISKILENVLFYERIIDIIHRIFGKLTKKEFEETIRVKKKEKEVMLREKQINEWNRWINFFRNALDRTPHETLFGIIYYLPTEILKAAVSKPNKNIENYLKGEYGKRYEEFRRILNRLIELKAEYWKRYGEKSKEMLRREVEKYREKTLQILKILNRLLVPLVEKGMKRHLLFAEAVLRINENAVIKNELQSIGSVGKDPKENYKNIATFQDFMMHLFEDLKADRNLARFVENVKGVLPGRKRMGKAIEGHIEVHIVHTPHLKIFTGELGGTCIRENRAPEKGFMHFTIFVGKTALGEIYAFKTKTHDGKPALILAGIEPRLGILEKVDPKDFTRKTLEAFKRFAEERGYELGVSTVGGTGSNRREILEALQKLAKKHNWKEIEIEPTGFRGYRLTRVRHVRKIRK